MTSRGDLKLLRMSMRWETSKLRELMVEGLPEDLQSEDARTRASARKVVLAMEAQNQKDEHKQLDEFKSILSTIATRVGLNPDSDGVEEAPAGVPGSNPLRITEGQAGREGTGPSEEKA